MQSVYKIRIVNHIRSLKYILIGLSLVVLVCYFIPFYEKNYITSEGLMVGAIPVLIFIAPAIFLHISYYIKNSGLKIVIDENQSTLIVSKSGKEHFYNFSDLILVEQHLAIYHRNRIDHINRKIVPWASYGYLLLKFNDGLQLYVTSLMLDVLKPPIITTHTYFRLFPYMKSGIDFSKKRVIVNENYENKISQYKLTFKHHSDQQLNEKIINRKTYDKSAVEAARLVLATRVIIQLNKKAEMISDHSRFI
ncbi:hypothetical protein LPB86_20335 [Pedobacter sp. MC2016-14]|uniref:hypothetical protein n=1 Tax=Pedobacter sp. MC2016-14 TaxID=2897327 RepID=UPI001E6372EB|nr:hypothetical protein [Pedobacter sp. MC2016-14]MCD0490598.1 hypothetical protein [Pedobacter sp. MC2016-14]